MFSQYSTACQTLTEEQFLYDGACWGAALSIYTATSDPNAHVCVQAVDLIGLIEKKVSSIE